MSVGRVAVRFLTRALACLCVSLYLQWRHQLVVLVCTRERGGIESIWAAFVLAVAALVSTLRAF